MALRRQLAHAHSRTSLDNSYLLCIDKNGVKGSKRKMMSQARHKNNYFYNNEI